MDGALYSPIVLSAAQLDLPLHAIIPPIPEFAPRNPAWEGLSVKVKAGSRCAYCRKTHDLEAHHIVPFHLQPALELVEANLVVLCRWCHFVIGHFGDWKLFNPCILQILAAVEADVDAILATGAPTQASIDKLLKDKRYKHLHLDAATAAIPQPPA